MQASDHIATVRAIHSEAHRRGLMFQTCENETLQRSTSLRLEGQDVLAFCSSSYLGLEFHPALIEGALEATERYGTQFPTSRAYVSTPLYSQLEDSLSQIFSGHPLVTTSTAHAHQLALSVLATENDAIVLDNRASYCVQQGVLLAGNNGAQIELVRHGEPNRALEIIEHLARNKQTVWFVCEGVNAMLGDLAPLEILGRLADIAPNVRIYVNDAHGMSWTGKHGRGSFLSRMPLHPRIVLGTSLELAFSAGGGCLICSSEEERDNLRLASASFCFSSPLQPPLLGAAEASARLHLSEGIAARQKLLRERVDLTNHLLRQRRLPLLVENETPIFFLRLGLPRVVFRVQEKLLADGIFVVGATYPAVPIKAAGIRIALTAEHRQEDIVRVVDALSRHIPTALEKEGITSEEIDALFDGSVPRESLISSVYTQRVDGRKLVPILPDPSGAALQHEASPAHKDGDLSGGLRLHTLESIREIDKSLWNSRIAKSSACSWEAMQMAEEVFSTHSEREHNWNFHYMMVNDEEGQPLATTFFTRMLGKDDMLMSDEVSRAVEKRRERDPYYLTSEFLMMGSTLSEGRYLSFNRQGQWRRVLDPLIDEAIRLYDKIDASILLLRDLPGEDPEMDAYILDRGFIKIPILNSNRVTITWKNQAEYFSLLSRAHRRHLRYIIENSLDFTREVYGCPNAPTLSKEDFGHLYKLYRNVASRRLKLNVFPFPPNLFPAMERCPAWEIVTFQLSREAGGPEDGRPVAWYAAHQIEDDYIPVLCGLDYRYVYSHGAYRQMLYQCVKRCEELGIRRIHLGSDAEIEKARIGAKTSQRCLYAKARDHFHGEIIREIAAESGPWHPPGGGRGSRSRDAWHVGGRP